MKLRDYQQKTLDKVIEFIGSDGKELIIKLYTGLGKTFLMPRMAVDLNKKGYNVLVLSDIMQLINQLEKHFEDMSMSVSKITADDRTNKVSPITLASEQTLVRRLTMLNKLDNIVILYDEAHKRRFGSRFKKIMRYFKPIKLIGFSATPFDMKGVKLFDNTYEPISYLEAENKKYLTPVNYFVHKKVKELDFDSIEPNNMADYTASDIEQLYSNDSFKNWFTDFIGSLNLNNRQTLVFASNIKMAEKIANTIGLIEPSIGIVHSKQKQKLNEEIIASFKEGSTKVLVSVTSLTTGFDAPNVDTIINIRPTKSIPLFHQIIGRGSRIHNSKDSVEFYDLTNTLLTYGFPETFTQFEDLSEYIEHLMDNQINDTYLNYTEADNTGSVELSIDNIDEFKFKLEELRKSNIKIASIDELRLMFDNENDIKIIIDIANEVARRRDLLTLKPNQIVWVVSELTKYLELLSELNKTKSTIKAYKTRIKNILNNGKKLTSMGYFAEWFYEQTITKYNLR